MDRIFRLIGALALSLFAAPSFAATCDAEMAQCQTMDPNNHCRVSAGDLNGQSHPMVERSWRGQTPWVFSAWCEVEAQTCEAGGDSQQSTVAGQDNQICNNGCEYQCKHNGSACMNFDLGDGWYTTGTWSQTGQTCGGDDDEEPEPQDCKNLGASGFQFCESDPPGCVRTPSGAQICANLPGPDCATAPSGAVCANQQPPDGYGPPQPFTVCPPSGCIGITVAPPDDDDDDECEPGDEGCEEEPDDCPANDPDCEDDNQCPEGTTGTPPNCETEDSDGVCTEENQTVCDILRDIRTATQKTASNTSLQLKEDRETNTKLTAIKNQVAIDARVALAATNRVQVATDSVRTAVNNSATTVAASNTAAANTISNAINAASTTATTNSNTLGGKLDTIAGKLDGLAGCGGVGQPACSGGGGDGSAAIVDAVHNPDWTHVDPVDAGEGVTQADTDAAKVKSIDIGVGDIDTDGFGLGSSCPTFPQMSLGGMSWEIDSGLYCTFLDIVNAVLMLAGALAAVYILLGD